MTIEQRLDALEREVASLKACIGQGSNGKQDSVKRVESTEECSKLEAAIKKGAAIRRITPAGSDDPLARFAGTWSEDDPVIQQWEKAVEEYRRQIDADSEVS